MIRDVPVDVWYTRMLGILDLMYIVVIIPLSSHPRNYDSFLCRAVGLLRPVPQVTSLRQR